jgi:4a-hydroxytetrahydrobiopterin dehydratase
MCWKGCDLDLAAVPAGGLTENDFIIASKINDLDLADLLPKKKPKFWA